MVYFRGMVLQVIGRLWTNDLAHAVPLARECRHVVSKAMKYVTVIMYRWALG